MPIENFEGKTFVAFIDISGFKELMKEKDKALEALDLFYSTGYKIVKEKNNYQPLKVEGIFISDCGIMFMRGFESNNLVVGLEFLLQKIKEINEKMLEKDFMLTTSISYGEFKYQKRIEITGIRKNPLYGNAYVDAYFDNEKAKPKIQSGQCRIIIDKLPEQIKESIIQNNDNLSKFIKKRGNDNKHYYYYWMCNSSERINSFENSYKDAYNLKYQGILKALKEAY